MKYIIILLILIVILIVTNKSTFNSSSMVIDKVYDLYYTRFKNRFTLNDNTIKLDSVDMVYVMSMPQRREYITNQINSLGIQCKYLDAVKPDDFTDSEITLLSDVNTPGEYMYKHYTRLAVVFSFTMCYIDAIVNGYSTIIVFEDDIIVNVDLDTLNKSTTEFVKSDNDTYRSKYTMWSCNMYKSKDFKRSCGIFLSDEKTFG